MAYDFINEEPVKFKQWTCNVQKMKYGNGRPALVLLEQSTYEPIATATINMPEVKLKPKEIIIKDYSENNGMYQALRDAGMIGPATGAVPTGYVEGIKCMLLV